MNIHELRNEATRIAKQAEAVLPTITTENRAEKEAEFNRMMADSDTFAAKANMLEASEKRQREFEAIETPIPGLTRSTTNTDEEKRAAAIVKYLTGDLKEAELRALGIGVQADGGYTVANAPMAKLVTTLQTFGPMLNSNVFTVLNTAGGNPLPIPTNDDTANEAALTAEHGAYDEHDLTFGLKTLKAYKVTTMLKASDEFLRDSAVQPEDHVTTQLGRRLGRKGNKYLTVGTGSNQPGGIVTGAGVGLTSVASAAISADEALKLQFAVDNAYRSVGSYMANDNTIVSFRTLKDADNRYVWGAGDIASGVPERLHGKPVISNNDMPNIGASNRALIFGDMSAFWVRIAGGVNIKRLNELFAATGEVGFQGAMSIDGIVTDTAAIKALVQKSA